MPSDVGVLFGRELRVSLRERSVVVFSFLLPLVLYPAMLWMGLSLVLLAEGHTDRQVIRVAIEHPERAPAVAEALREAERIEPVALSEPAVPALRGGMVDAVVRFQAVPAEAPPGDFRLVLLFDGARARSEAGRAHLEGWLAERRDAVLRRHAERHGVAPEELGGVGVRTENRASEAEMGSFLLGSVAPMTMLLMLTMAAVYPAIDTTAGERERSTWETTLGLGVPLWKVALAKYLLVALLATVGGLLNLAGLTVSLLLLLRSMAPEGLTFAVSPSGWAVLLAGTVMLALVVSAAVLVVASWARTFRQGQSMVSPLVLLVLLASLVLMLPDAGIAGWWALVPIAGGALLLEQGLRGAVDVGFLALTLLTSAVVVAASIAAAGRMMGREAFAVLPESWPRRGWGRRRAR